MRVVLTRAPLAVAIEWMGAVGAQWDARLARLVRAASAVSQPRPGGRESRPPRPERMDHPIVNSCVCGLRCGRRMAPAVSFPLKRKTFRPSLMWPS
jgi:hypothetical protein